MTEARRLRKLKDKLAKKYGNAYDYYIPHSALKELGPGAPFGDLIKTSTYDVVQLLVVRPVARVSDSDEYIYGVRESFGAVDPGNCTESFCFLDVVEFYSGGYRKRALAHDKLPKKFSVDEFTKKIDPTKWLTQPTSMWLVRYIPGRQIYKDVP